VPTAPPCRCTQTGCNQLTTHGRCPDHTRRPWEQRSPRDHISRRPWRRARAAQLARHPGCQLTYPGCTTTATEVDHIISIALGGHPTDPANLQSCCDPCHTLKTAQDRRHAAALRTPGHPTG